MESYFSPLKRGGCWWPLVFLALLLSVRSGEALTIPNTFDNSGGWANQTLPIQATNFVNEAPFSYTIATGSYLIPSLYQNWQYVRNFTNTADGEMDCNSGFYFNTYIPAAPFNYEAVNFYNAGPINCGLNDTFYVVYDPVNLVNYYGGVDVWATNIYNSGIISVGVDGLARFAGDNIDFESGGVMLQSPAQFIGISLRQQHSMSYISATGQSDIYTNKWNPSGNFGNPPFADGQMISSPYDLFLDNAVPYVDVSQISQTNFLVRMVFLQDASVGVATNVYFDYNSALAHVEWIGSYTDPASGQPANDYLYLDNDYVKGSSTNALRYGDPGAGVPDCFTFVITNGQRNLGGASAPDYVDLGLLSPRNVTGNIYSYVNASVISSDVPTNQMLNGAPSLLPGRVEMTAAKSLNLSQAAITGMNYLLMNSTNEFDTDGQSAVAVPFSDIFIGHTNNSMVVSNVLASQIPSFSGTVQAWTTEWKFTDTNNVIYNPYANTTNPITYEYRVLLVSSQLTPTGVPQTGNLQVYSSNNVVISDVFNISSNLFLNCTNLLLTTNGIGMGAASPDGELNLLPTTFSWAAATARLRCLTNNGAIRTTNANTLQVFGSAASSYLALFNTGLINNAAGTSINSLDFENYGTMMAGSGSFTAQSLTTTMSNGVVQAGAAFSDTGSNVVITGTSIQAGRGFTLAATNLLTDNGVMSGNFWSLGAGYAGFTTGTGLNLPILPAAGDLLGTTITNIAAAGSGTGLKITDTWAGTNYGYSTAGYHNNAAIGQLVLDAQASNSKFYFTGTGTNNAIYVDCLYLQDYAAYNPTNHPNNTIPLLSFNTNLVIYYAQAINPDGSTVAEKINGYNTNHLRWMPTYAGYFSSTNIVYPDGTTNAVNAALAASTDTDSDHDGRANSLDPTPVLVPSQLKFTVAVTNPSPHFAKLGWQTIPQATNFIYYTTNLLLPESQWLPFTNFANYYWGAGSGTAVTNASHSNNFISPQPYINNGSWPADNWETTNVWIFDTVTNVPHFYRILVQPY